MTAFSQAVACYSGNWLEVGFSYVAASYTANCFLTPSEGASCTSASGSRTCLLPGLIGLGLNLWRKRRSETQRNSRR
ncbi:PTPA-CTERM sorting domain-containing protein [Leptolyngbya sp. NK1-12]|uniref:PTPA-CTERM sorting domain-containing protein n=1 Tax=Leptolyngbya sp. NK1-12 TaxID=2547451 RepID=A0AA97AHV2_9CYAN|nr:PTPA-CTERM sorting domain-containing protein [Leptolyngbya sp. NK1-12]